jgi:hypothetical protein
MDHPHFLEFAEDIKLSTLGKVASALGKRLRVKIAKVRGRCVPCPQPTIR